ncbi:hypothetical protein [Coleofasciculus sp. E2-BRE-01]|uniref:hypothetical protein n=1 Tax=Coleofasciculus sp. E2-BRE-01 TaxID=3069524 RepID=UPI0032F0A0E3
MSSLKISDLNPAGSELLLDSESYLNELTNEELNLTHGGSSVICSMAAITAIAQFSYQLGRDARRRQEHKNGNVCYP